MNKLIIIGPMSALVCYLNISKEEAQRRYNLDNPDMSEYINYIEELEFEDEFGAYSIWPKTK